MYNILNKSLLFIVKGIKFMSISVIMPVYNSETFLKDSINSILKQTFIDFDFIIIDDGSTDNTEIIIKSFNDNRIKYLKTDHHGISSALNYAINYSNSEYIIRMDADDIALPDRIEKQISYMKNNPHLDITGCGMLIIDEDNELIGKKKLPFDSKQILSTMPFYCTVMHPTFCFKKSAFLKLKGYRNNFIYAQDYDFLLRSISLGLTIDNLNYNLVKYRMYKKGNLKKMYNQMRYTLIAQQLFKERSLNNMESQYNQNYFNLVENLGFKKFLLYLFNYSNKMRNSKHILNKIFWYKITLLVSCFDKILFKTMLNDLYYFKFMLKK